MTGTGNNLTRHPLARTGVTTVDYPTADRGDSQNASKTPKPLIEDASGRPTALWMLGRLALAMPRGRLVYFRAAAIGRPKKAKITSNERDTPASPRHRSRNEFRRRCRLETGDRASHFAGSGIHLRPDISRPGDLLVTSRLGIDLLVLRPTLIRGIIEA